MKAIQFTAGLIMGSMLALLLLGALSGCAHKSHDVRRHCYSYSNYRDTNIEVACND